MKLYCVLRGIKPSEIIYNHALFYDEISQEIYEADYPRVVKVSVGDWKSKRKNRTAIVKTLDLSLTTREQDEIREYLKNQVGKRYEVFNFWWHILKVFTGKWWGPRNDKRLYCYELVIYALNRSYRFSEDPYLNPYQFCKKFKVYDV